MAVTLINRKALVVSAFFVFCLPPFSSHAALDCPPDRIDRSAQVANIYDGDTLRLRNGEKVRLIGINTPELGRDGYPSEPFARKATDRLKSLLLENGFRINLRYGNESQDRYKRRLAHAYLPDNRSIAAVLLREGLGTRVTVPPNVRDFQCYRKAELQAREKRLGVWSLPQYSGVAVEQLSTKKGGFHIVQDKVEKLRKRNGSIYLTLGRHLTLTVHKKDVAYFPAGFLKTLLHKQVRIRGWISTKGGKLRMRLRHPAEVEVE